MSSILKVLVVSLLVLRANLLTAACEEVDSLEAAIVAACGALRCADNQVILRCMETENMQAYFDLRKDQIVTQVRAFIDGLLPRNGPFLHGSVVVGDDWRPADHSRDAFKTALGRYIISARLGTAAPDSRDTDSLSRFKQTVDGEFRKIICRYMDALLPVCTKMLHHNVPIPHSAEVQLHKYTFMGAVCKLISEVEPPHDVADSLDLAAA